MLKICWQSHKLLVNYKLYIGPIFYHDYVLFSTFKFDILALSNVQYIQLFVK